jgi:hypothetical protein
MWPRRRPVRRAARWDGIAPIIFDIDTDEFSPPTAAVINEITAYALAHRKSADPFDVAVSGTHQPGIDLSEWLEELEQAGATWWRDGWIPWGGVEHDDWLADVVRRTPSP